MLYLCVGRPVRALHGTRPNMPCDRARNTTGPLRARHVCASTACAPGDVRRLRGKRQGIWQALLLLQQQRPPPQRTDRPAVRPQRQHGPEGARHALLIAVLGSEHALEGHVHLDLQHGAPDREPARDPPVELLLQNADELRLAQLLLLRKEPPQPPRAHSRLWGKRRPALRRWRIRRAPNRQPPQERCGLEE